MTVRSHHIYGYFVTQACVLSFLSCTGTLHKTVAIMPFVAKQSNRRRVVIVGSGWAGATMSTALDERKYKITVVSPEETTPYTPLLASAACGLYDFRYNLPDFVYTLLHRRGLGIKEVADGP